MRSCEFTYGYISCFLLLKFIIVFLHSNNVIFFCLFAEAILLVSELVCETAVAWMYACSFASVAWASYMFYMLYNSHARAESKLFVVVESSGLFLAMAFVILVLFDPSTQELSFPVTVFTLSVLLLFSIMSAKLVTASNFLFSPSMPGKAWRSDPPPPPDDVRYASSCCWPFFCQWWRCRRPLRTERSF